MTIIEYNKKDDIIVQFEDGSIKHTAYQCFKKGEVKSKFYRGYYGVGYTGDTTIMNGKNIKKSFQTWSGIIERCYSEKSFKTRPTYENCTVCDEWLCYANFEKWYDEHYYELDNERMNLDKDILYKHNKEYNPKYCIFVPSKINSLFTKSDKARGELPIGVKEDNGKYRARVNQRILGKMYSSHVFNTIEEAFNDYKTVKENYIKEVADYYKNKYPQFPKKLYDAMYNYKVEITD